MDIKRTLLTLLLVFIPFILFPQDTLVAKKWGYKGYSGGMFIHLGYVQSKSFEIFDLQTNMIEQQIKGVTFGLGGKMSIYLNRYFRVGGEGYFSTCQYGKYKSGCRIGWGGVTFDLLYPIKKWAPFFGLTVGGGSATHQIFIEKQKNNQEAVPIVHFVTPLYVLDPAIGVEFMASNRISILFKMDYIFNLSKLRDSYPQGVRFYLGVHFYQKK